MNSSRERTAGSLLTGGAVVTALLSSACCWLPLLLIGLGTSAVGVAGFFAAYRSYLLLATALFLGAGFYLVYFRKARCAEGSTCAVPNPRLMKFQKAMLWVATAVVLAFALFPSYLGLLISGDQAPTAAAFYGESRVFGIEGMTCEACAAIIKDRLVEVPGVAGAEVSYNEKTARIFAKKNATPPTDAAIEKAISETGYRGQRIEH